MELDASEITSSSERGLSGLFSSESIQEPPSVLKDNKFKIDIFGAIRCSKRRPIRAGKDTIARQF